MSKTLRLYSCYSARRLEKEAISALNNVFLCTCSQRRLCEQDKSCLLTDDPRVSARQFHRCTTAVPAFYIPTEKVSRRG